MVSGFPVDTSILLKRKNLIEFLFHSVKKKANGLLVTECEYSKVSSLSLTGSRVRMKFKPAWDW